MNNRIIRINKKNKHLERLIIEKLEYTLDHQNFFVLILMQFFF